MGSDYHYRKIARWEELAGVKVPVDDIGHYLNPDDIRGEEARDLTAPYGSLHFAVGFGEEGDDGGDWFTCFDFAELPDGRIALDSTENSESGAYCAGVDYTVVSREEAPRVALEWVENALETVALNGHKHDRRGWNQDPYYFVRAVAKVCGVAPWKNRKEDELRRGRRPKFRAKV